MSNIKFVSHEAFPEDPYTRELVYLLLDDKYRVAYTRKLAKNGGMFWSGVSISVVKDGVKTYYEAFMQDSNFMEMDIKRFLDERQWEKPKTQSLPQTNFTLDSELPF